MIIQKKNLFISIIFLFIALEIFLTAYLSFISGNDSYLCSTLGSCLEVQESIYGKFLGAKVAVLGLISFIIFLFLYIFSIMNKKFKIIYLIASILGALIAIYFIFIQIFILKKICSSCVFIDVLMILISYVSTAEYKYHQKNK
ncbi:MAG: vitamin K epoxide reductase family protein [Nanoarchaeota archaeon]